MKTPYTCFLFVTVTFTSLVAQPSVQEDKNGEPGVWKKEGWVDEDPWIKTNEERIQEEQLFPSLRDEVKIQSPIPTQYDWRTFGVISPVKNMGALGSSIAIAAAECVESLHAIHSSQLLLLSPSEVQDCCDFSLVTNTVFQCIANVTIPGPCNLIMGGRTVPQKDVSDMVMALLLRPFMVFVDASQTSFLTYTGGIYDDPDCSMDGVDHAMQVVGYGEEEGQEYWICKNSFGESWGENGYIRISKGKNVCGIESFVSYPF